MSRSFTIGGLPYLFTNEKQSMNSTPKSSKPLKFKFPDPSDEYDVHHIGADVRKGSLR